MLHKELIECVPLLKKTTEFSFKDLICAWNYEQYEVYYKEILLCVLSPDGEAVYFNNKEFTADIRQVQDILIELYHIKIGDYV